MSTDFVAIVAQEVVKELASEAITGLFKNGFKIAREVLSAPDDLPESTPAGGYLSDSVDPLEREFRAFERLAQLKEARVHELCEEAAACANDFLYALQYGDHQRACAWCEPDLFDHPERKAALLETLSAARPGHWEPTAYRLPPGSETVEIPWVGVDYAVAFNVDGEDQIFPLLIYMTRYGDGWRVWDLQWDPGHT